MRQYLVQGAPRIARNGEKDTYEDVGHDCEWSDGEKMDGGGGWNERREKECPSILIIHPDRCCVWDLIIDWGRLDQSTDYESIRVALLSPAQWRSTYFYGKLSSSPDPSCVSHDTQRGE